VREFGTAAIGVLKTSLSENPPCLEHAMKISSRTARHIKSVHLVNQKLWLQAAP
jgi:hypothetical protein